MRRLLSLMAVAVAVMVVGLAPIAIAQQPAPAQTERTFEGELTKVDATAKTLSVKGTTEMVFTWTDQTRVLGPEKTIQGLAAKAGTPLKVTYHADQAGKNMATQIEAVERK